jgi:hypothetical protein
MTELGGWNYDTLAMILKDHADNLDGLGFDGDDLDDVLAMTGQLPPPPGTGTGDDQEDDPTRLWPIISVKVAPEVFRIWQTKVQDSDGESETDVLSRLIRG